MITNIDIDFGKPKSYFHNSIKNGFDSMDKNNVTLMQELNLLGGFKDTLEELDQLNRVDTYEYIKEWFNKPVQTRCNKNRIISYVIKMKSFKLVITYKDNVV